MCCDSFDATHDTGLGRLVNDDHHRPNTVMKKLIFDEQPVLCLFAVNDIQSGEELRFNYGPDEKGTMHWRKVIAHQWHN